MQSLTLEQIFITPTYSFALREDLKNEKQFLPFRAEPKATGWDVRAAQEDREQIILHPFQKKLLPLGFRAFCPEGWWFEARPRSSTFAKKHLHCLYGVVDQTYEGQCFLSLQYLPENTLSSVPDNLVINFGDPIAQIIPVRRQEMQVLEKSNEEYDLLCKNRGGERGAGGFGSTTEKPESKQLSFKGF